MRELLIRVWYMSSDELLAQIEVLFIKLFYIWAAWMILKIMWKKVNK